MVIGKESRQSSFGVRAKRTEYEWYPTMTPNGYGLIVPKIPPFHVFDNEYNCRL